MLVTVVFLSGFLQAVVSYLIYRNGRRNPSYRLFLWLSLVTLLWSLLNYLSLALADTTYLIYVVRAILCVAILQVFLFYLFVHAFPYGAQKITFEEISQHLLFTTVALIITASPLVFSGIKVIQGVPDTQVSGGIAIFIAYITFYIVNAFRVLLRKFHEAVGLKRTQLLLILAAAALNWAVIPFTNFALTLALNTMIFVQAAPLYGFLFSGIVAYALFRHRLFDSRIILRNSTIHIGHCLRDRTQRSAEYYHLEYLVDMSDSQFIALDFTGVKNLDYDAITLLKVLRKYIEQQGKMPYLFGYSPKVFQQLRPLRK